RGSVPPPRTLPGRPGASLAPALRGLGARNGAASCPPHRQTGSRRSPRGDTSPVDNDEIARTLDAYAGLLDLAGAATWSVRAYRRAADLIRSTPAPVEELVRSGRVRDLRGIGPGIERRLRELVETGGIAELEELEREVEPELVALGRYLGLGPRRLVSLGRALGIRTADELRAAAEAGRLREAPGIGPATEAKVLEALARGPQPARRGLTRNRALALADAIAAPLDAVAAGELRRGC